MGDTSRGVAQAALCGAGLSLAFAGASFFFLAWIALTPYLLYLLGRPRWTATLAAHGALGLVYFGGVLHWMPGVLAVQGRLGWPAASVSFSLALLALTLLLLPFTVLTRWAAGRSQELALACAPGLWLLTEWLRGGWFWGGVPWVSLGYSQLSFSSLAQTADLAGVGAVTLLVVLANCIWAALFSRQNRKLAGIFAGLLLLANLYGLYRLRWWTPPTGYVVRTALAPTSIEAGAGRAETAQAYFEALPRAYKDAVAQGADWMVLPRASNPFVFGSDFYYTTFWKRLVSDYRVPALLSGPFSEGGDSQSFHATFLLDGAGEVAYRSDSAAQAVWGDCLASAPAAGAPRRVDAAPGSLHGVRFGLLIGQQALQPEASVRASQAGASLLLNLTDDSCFGSGAASWQRLQITAFRAIEQRRPLVRAANGGVTALIDPWGRFQERIAPSAQGTLVVEARTSTWPSPYSRLGDWPCRAWSVLSLLAALGAGRRKRKKRRR